MIGALAWFLHSNDFVRRCLHCTVHIYTCNALFLQALFEEAAKMARGTKGYSEANYYSALKMVGNPCLYPCLWLLAAARGGQAKAR